MPFCPNCGAEIESGVSFCPYCGGQTTAPGNTQSQMPEPPAAPEPPVDQFYPQAPQQDYSQPNQQPVYPQNYSQPVQEQVTPVPTGGLIAWSIITILLCWILGIVALVQTIGINKATTVAEQQKKISTARTCCIIGTVVGILSIIGSVAANSMG